MDYILQIGISPTNEITVHNRWSSLVEIKDTLNIPHSQINQAVKMRFRSLGYYWIWESSLPDELKQLIKKDLPCYINNNELLEFILPSDSQQVRNRTIFYYTYPEMEYKGKFINAVEASKHLGVSISTIRRVLNKKIEFFEKYYFTYTPLKEEHLLIPYTKVIKFFFK